LTSRDGAVLHIDGRRATYGELAARAAKLPLLFAVIARCPFFDGRVYAATGRRLRDLPLRGFSLG
jgi:hypothetical protein